MVIKRVNESVGDPAIKQIDKIISTVAGRPPEETLEALDRYSMQWYISREGTLFVRFWQAVAETFAITPVTRDRFLTLSRDQLVAIADSAFGMWADREDFGDTAEYVRSLRARWKRRLEDVESD